MKGCGLAFSIIFGLANNIFSFIFKDILICFMNLIIYIGLLIYFYLYYSNAQLFEGENHKKGDGIVDIIIMIAVFVLITVLAFTLKNGIGKKTGIMFILLYAAYLTYIILRNYCF